MKPMISGLIALGTLLPVMAFGTGALAQDGEKLVVRGEYNEKDIPGVTLTRRADFLLLEVKLVNDSLERTRREAELRETLDMLLSAAAGEPLIEVSVIDEDGYVLTLDPRTPQVAITNDSRRRDTSLISVRLKTRIPADTPDSHDLVARLRGFADGLEKVGRTIVTVDTDIAISLVNPAQYRRQLITMMAEDLAFVRETLSGTGGASLVPQIFGLSKPVEWFRAGPIDVTLFIPYAAVMVPDTVTSFTYIDER